MSKKKSTGARSDQIAVHKLTYAKILMKNAERKGKRILEKMYNSIDTKMVLKSYIMFIIHHCLQSDRQGLNILEYLQLDPLLPL